MKKQTPGMAAWPLLLAGAFAIATALSAAEPVPIETRINDLLAKIIATNAAEKAQQSLFAQLRGPGTLNACKSATNFVPLESALLKLDELAAGKKIAIRQDDILAALAEVHEASGAGARADSVRRKIAAMKDADPKNKSRALAALSDKVRGGRWDVWSPQYIARYIDLKPEAELEKMKKEYIDLLEQRMAVDAGNPAFLMEYANYHLLTLDNAGKAEPVYKKLAAMEKLPDQQRAAACYGLVNAALLRGSRAEAERLLKDFNALNLKAGAGRGQSDYIWQLRNTAELLDGDAALDHFQLPLHSGARAFPEPQEAEYTETFAPVKAIRIELGKGLDMKAPGLRYILPKLKRMGVAIDDSSKFVLKVNSDDALKAPEKKEGYALKVARDGASIAGFDSQGVTWGLVSFMQLFDSRNGPRVRICSINDWPGMAVRGFYNTDVNCMIPEMAIYSKMNLVIMQGANALHGWGVTPLLEAEMKAMTGLLRDFGFQVMYGAFSYTMYPKYPLTSERTFELHQEVFGKVAALGAGIYFPYDDGRYPLHPQDEKISKIGANQDAKYLTRLYRAIKAKHPVFSMIFCPPFYWGPDAPASYPEDRENYLRSLGEHLDPEILVFWTGPRVKGYQVTPDKVKWFADLIRRKPTYAQNGWGPHNLIHYTADPIYGWKSWHYDGFQQDVHSYLCNSSVGVQAPLICTLADWQWNEKGFDADRSTQAMVDAYYGHGMFSAMRPAALALARIDKYRYGAITPEAVHEIPMLDEVAKAARASLAKAEELNKPALDRLPCYFKQGVGFAEKALAAARSAPDFFKRYEKEIEAVREQAKADLGFDPEKGDVLKHAVDFSGTQGPMVYGFRSAPRFGAPFRGSEFQANSARFSFECDPFPPSGAYDLYLSGQYETAKGEPEFQIRITLNGEEVYKGPCGLAVSAWKVSKFTLPFEKLKRGNTVVIESATPGDTQSGPPWLLVNYVMLRKQKG
ncbi:MAG: hypothetical protein GX608_09145 [Lentisphaerae bacterium]|nr:hypothetical protein [Lentisphaerota bacterium]